LYTCQTVLDGQAAGTGISKAFSIPLVSFNPTSFPRSVVYSEMRVLTPVLTSNADAVFVSCFIKQKLHEFNGFRGDFPFGYPAIPGVFVDGKNADWVGVNPASDTVYGYYSRYDRKTKTIATKTVLLRQGQVTPFNTIRNINIDKAITPPNFFLFDSTRRLFITGMYQDDPRKEIYSTTSSLNVALDQNYETITYDKTKGYALFLSLHRSSQFKFYYVYRAEYPQGLNYSLAYAALGSAQNYFTNLEEPPVSFDRPLATTPATVVTYTLVDVSPYDPTKPLTGIAPFE
jgi:hypothetical protein